MGIEYAENMTNHQTTSTGKRSARDYIKDWRKTKADLQKRAGELKKRADTLKKNNPALSAELMKRAKALSDEAAAMNKPKKGEKGLSTEQIRRSAALGRLAMLKDKG